MKTLFLIATATFFLFSCKKESPELTKKTFISNSDIIIKYGKYQGWCAGDDSLVISYNNIQYTSYSPCDELKTKIVNGTISSEEKNEILKAINFDEFKQIDLNTCNVCADGTDYWISIKQNTYFHKIRFGYSDTVATKNIKILIKLLDQQKDKLN